MVKTLLICLVALASTGCASLREQKDEPLHVSLVSIAPLQVGLLEQRYALKLRVQNPRPHEVPLQGVSLDLNLNGRAFGRGTGATAVVVPAFGEEVVEINAVTTLQDVLSTLGDLSAAAREPVNYKLQGRLYTGSGGDYERFSNGGKLTLAPQP
jgi:LEA14-like dessication related protein